MDELNHAAESGASMPEEAGSTSDDGQVNAQLARIRAMDPEMRDLGALLPDATDEEIRRYYNQDRKRFGR